MAKAVKTWRDACSSGKANILKFGGVKQGKYKWQVKDVTVTDVQYQKAVKKLAAATMQINFVEFYKKGSAKKSGSSSSGKKPAKKKPTSSVPSSTSNKPPTQQGGNITGVQQ